MTDRFDSHGLEIARQAAHRITLRDGAGRLRAVPTTANRPAPNGAPSDVHPELMNVGSARSKRSPSLIIIAGL